MVGERPLGSNSVCGVKQLPGTSCRFAVYKQVMLNIFLPDTALIDIESFFAGNNVDFP